MSGRRKPILRTGQCWLIVRARRYCHVVGFTISHVRVAFMDAARPRYIQINDFLDRARSGAYRASR